MCTIENYNTSKFVRVNKYVLNTGKCFQLLIRNKNTCDLESNIVFPDDLIHGIVCNDNVEITLCIKNIVFGTFIKSIYFSQPLPLELLKYFDIKFLFTRNSIPISNVDIKLYTSKLVIPVPIKNSLYWRIRDMQFTPHNIKILGISVFEGVYLYSECDIDCTCAKHSDEAINLGATSNLEHLNIPRQKLGIGANICINDVERFLPQEYSIIN